MNKLVIDNEQFKSLVNTLCREITISGWRPDYVVGITRGGLIPAVMISHYFGVPCDALKVSLRDDTQGPESNLWMAEDAFGYVPQEEQAVLKSRWDISKRKKILIVDDINDTGATFNWIKQDWQGSCLPNETTAWNAVWGNSVRFAVLVDNLSSNCEFAMNYSAMEVNKAEDDVWVDFHWEGWWTK